MAEVRVVRAELDDVERIVRLVAFATATRCGRILTRWCQSWKGSTCNGESGHVVRDHRQGLARSAALLPRRLRVEADAAGEGDGQLQHARAARHRHRWWLRR